MLGKVLKYNRIKKQKKQEDICKGICSISYYSKIENDQMEPSPELYKKLMSRLGIDENKLRKQDGSKVKEEVLSWGELLIEKNMEQAKESYFHLQEKIPFVEDVKIKLLCDIFYIRYCYIVEDYQNGKDKLEDIKKTVYELNDPELLFYLYKCEIGYLYFDGEFPKAKEIIEKAEKIVNEAVHSQLQIIDFYFIAGILYQNLYNDNVSIYYLKKALNGFERTYNYFRCGECRLAIGISYSKLKQYDEAKKNYLLAEKIAKQINNQWLEASVLHNLGEIYASTDDPFQAIRFFQLSYRLRKGEQRLVTISMILDEFYKLGHEQEMMTWIEHGFETVDDVLKKRELDGKEMARYYKFLYYRALVGEKYKQDYETLLTETIVPYFEEKKMAAYLAFFAGEVATYYERKQELKKAIEYFKKANDALKEMTYQT
ncbi:helix-turn-helix transcriptional regulator [Bacillus shivajii]|uniref:helix-turn-helix transcriptional regulator n=1 Tax=Bacillus shivajii TaxID=1983719 RepID=UPI001CFAA642|nr:helix-turn-helix transcriptional regulator [Bacillus shivajii]UCZ54024.1 helix-turn-helix transcriptional regulator [Bacillus shivajii]